MSKGLSYAIAALLLSVNAVGPQAWGAVMEPVEAQNGDGEFRPAEIIRDELLEVNRKPAVLGPAVVAPSSAEEPKLSAAESKDKFYIPVTEYDPSGESQATEWSPAITD